MDDNVLWTYDPGCPASTPALGQPLSDHELMKRLCPLLHGTAQRLSQLARREEDESDPRSDADVFLVLHHQLAVGLRWLARWDAGKVQTLLGDPGVVEWEDGVH